MREDSIGGWTTTFSTGFDTFGVKSASAGKLIGAVFAYDGIIWKEVGGGGALPDGTINQSLRHDGDGWIANNTLLIHETIGVAVPATGYVNFGQSGNGYVGEPFGELGYGFRSNITGEMQYKDLGGTWLSFNNLIGGIIKGVAWAWNFKMVNAGDFASPEVGLTVVPSISKDGVPFTALTGSPDPTEIGYGWYRIVIPAVDMNADAIIVRATAVGAAQTDRSIYTIS